MNGAESYVGALGVKNPKKNIVIKEVENGFIITEHFGKEHIANDRDEVLQVVNIILRKDKS